MRQNKTPIFLYFVSLNTTILKKKKLSLNGRTVLDQPLILAENVNQLETYFVSYV